MFSSRRMLMLILLSLVVVFLMFGCSGKKVVEDFDDTPVQGSTSTTDKEGSSSGSTDDIGKLIDSQLIVDKDVDIGEAL